MHHNYPRFSPGVSLTSCLANGQRWLSEAEASPSWQEKAAEGAGRALRIICNRYNVKTRIYGNIWEYMGFDYSG